MKTINNLLNSLEACRDAKDWAKDKSWETIYRTCPRGDWLLWLFQKTNPKDLRKLTLAKAYCANTVKHLMKDLRSIRALKVAISFGRGKSTRKQLNAAAYTAYTVAAAADVAAAAFAAYVYTAYTAYTAATTTAAPAATAAAAAADAAYAYTAAAAAYTDVAYTAADVRTKNQKLTADICRKYLPLSCWNIQYD